MYTYFHAFVIFLKMTKIRPRAIRKTQPYQRYNHLPEVGFGAGDGCLLLWRVVPRIVIL